MYTAPRASCATAWSLQGLYFGFGLCSCRVNITLTAPGPIPRSRTDWCSLCSSAAHILARNTGGSADNLAALQLPRGSRRQPKVGTAGCESRSESPAAGEAAGDLEMGSQLNCSTLDSESSSLQDIPQQQGQQGYHQQQQGQQQSVLQRMSAAFGLGAFPRRQGSNGAGGSGVSDDGIIGSRMQTQLSPVYSLGDEADEAAALTEGTELLQERA